ncbi:DUF4828 domain-containing protein [Carnobacterium sp. TMP28]|uniref:DUF4828 domain-containing protein n=1 Tax=Carnobacterium sp. TMP28 TaxID=3397060 RepID=UPI0039E11229
MKRKLFIKLFISFTLVSKLVAIITTFQKSQTTLDPLNFFIGKWHVSEPASSIEMSIQIKENRQVYLNNQLMNGQLVFIENDKLIFKDHFGYELIVTKTSPTTLNLFDEADEKNYQLVRETELLY